MPSRMVNGINYVPSRMATYVVAASDAPLHVRRQADYVCDGVADNVEIQAAIDALPAVGGVVRLSEGNFVLAFSIHFFKSNASLIGAGIGATTLTLANGVDTRVILVQAQTNVTISHFTIDGNGLNNAGVEAEGLRVHNCSFIRISDIEVHDAYNSGIGITLGIDCHLINSIVRNNGHGGVVSHGVTVSNASHRFQAVNCRVIDSQNMGINVSDSTAVTNYAMILGCVATGNGLEGFRQEGGKGHRIVNCYAAENGGHGIVIDETLGMAICGCHAYYNAGSGIALRGCHFTTVTGNVCNGNAGDAGIEIMVWGGVNVEKATITGNICHDDQGVRTQDYGIRIGANAHTYYIVRLNVLRNNRLGNLLDNGTGVPKSIGHNII